MDDLYQDTDMEDAIEAFMKGTESEGDDESPDDPSEQVDAEEPQDEPEDDAEDTDEEESDDDDSDDSEDEEEEGGDDEEDPAPEIDDEATVKVKLGEEEKTFTVAELKRLAGQESALTTRSKQLHEQRRAVESQGLYVANLLQQRHERAKAQAEKYAKVDLYKASRELDDDDFEALKSAKENADSELQAIEREGHEFMKRVQDHRAKTVRDRAQESLRVIQERIPEWNDELYGNIRQFAVKQGMSVEEVNEVVDPAAITMMHKAMLYDQAQKKSETVQKKVKKAPKKTVRKGENTNTQASKAKQARVNAMRSGEIDDVTDAFMAAMSE
jgi:hypothetical protein